MSEFEFEDRGGGRYALRGEMSFDTADRILRASVDLFDSQPSIELDLSAVTNADSAGLALMLEWKSRALARDGEFRFVAVPDGLLAIAKTTEVSDFI